MIREHLNHVQGRTNNHFEKSFAEQQAVLVPNTELQIIDFNAIKTFAIKGFDNSNHLKHIM